MEGYKVDALKRQNTYTFLKTKPTRRADPNNYLATSKHKNVAYN